MHQHVGKLGGVLHHRQASVEIHHGVADHIEERRHGEPVASLRARLHLLDDALVEYPPEHVDADQLGNTDKKLCRRDELHGQALGMIWGSTTSGTRRSIGGRPEAGRSPQRRLSGRVRSRVGAPQDRIPTSPGIAPALHRDCTGTPRATPFGEGAPHAASSPARPTREGRLHHHAGTPVVLHRCYTGAVLTLPCHHTGTTLVLSGCCPGIALAPCCYCTVTMMVLTWRCTGTVLVLSCYCAGARLILPLCWHCAGTRLVLYECCHCAPLVLQW